MTYYDEIFWNNFGADDYFYTKISHELLLYGALKLNSMDSSQSEVGA